MTTQIRNVDAERLSIATRTLCMRWWSNEGLDVRLREVLADVLSVLDVVAVVTTFAKEGVSLTYGTPSGRFGEHDLSELLRSFVDEMSSRQDASYIGVFRGLHVVGTAIVDASDDGSDGHKLNVVGYSAICFRDVPHTAEERKRFLGFHACSTAGLLFQMLHHRVRLFLPFPPRVAEYYWSASSSIPQGALRPPWDTKQSKRTVTLGYDLRKSTFCMENADDIEGFADWLDELAQILMAVAHLHGGIFDKFTGDGGLIHFLEKECVEIYGRTAVEQAVDSAIAMQKATIIHLGRLKELLRLDSKLLGGGIGIDVAPAHWSLDYRHNPITVGRGVVNACRLMDSTPARAIRLTNIAYRSLPNGSLRELFEEVDFVSKEFSQDMQITAWQLKDGTTMPAGDPDVEDICRRVYGRRL